MIQPDPFLVISDGEYYSGDYYFVCIWPKRFEVEPADDSNTSFYVTLSIIKTPLYGEKWIPWKTAESSFADPIPPSTMEREILALQAWRYIARREDPTTVRILPRIMQISTESCDITLRIDSYTQIPDLLRLHVTFGGSNDFPITRLRPIVLAMCELPMCTVFDHIYAHPKDYIISDKADVDYQKIDRIRDILIPKGGIIEYAIDRMRSDKMRILAWNPGRESK